MFAQTYRNPFKNVTHLRTTKKPSANKLNNKTTNNTPRIKRALEGEKY
jgi:hypothetical protein